MTSHKERPMLMQTEMVESTVDGRKTKTRRTNGLEEINENPNLWKPYTGDFYVDRKGRLCQKFLNGGYSTHCVCPYGNIGDIIWVRETFARVAYSSYRHSNGVLQMPIDDTYCAVFKAGWDRSAPNWKPSIHMPKSAARVWLEIKNITIERLHDISEEDAIAEGIISKVENKKSGKCTFYKDYANQNDWYWSAKASFMSLWQSINGRESWRQNPYVWVISFKVLSTTGKPAQLLQEVCHD